MSDMIPDLDQLRIDPAAPAVPRKRKSLRHKRDRQFVKGPIPLNHLALAAQAPGKALHVEVALWFYAGLRNTAQIKFPMRWLKVTFGVDRYTSYRGLAALEKAGLVLVIRHRGRASIVTLLEVST